MLDKNPLVSVVIPTYKRSDMLLDAIESVKNQTYKNIEIIVVDDNDKDSEYREKTKSKLRKYIESKEIRYIENEKNIGGSLTRNKGIKESNGKYVAFLDDDDIFMPTKIEKQVKLIEENINDGVGLVYCHCNGVDELGNILWENTNSYSGLPLYESMIYCIASTSLWLCDRQMLLDIGGFEDMPSKQDLLLMVKIIANNYKIMCVNEVLANYLEHSNEKISTIKATPRITEGYEKLRIYCERYYSKLSNKQIRDVKFRFSRSLCIQYIGRNMKKKALKEIYNMIKQNVFHISNIKMIIRLIKT